MRNKRSTKAKKRNPPRGPGNSKAMLVPVQASGYFRRHDLARRYRVSLVTIWEWGRRKVRPLPAPVRLSDNVVAWPVQSILEWERGLPGASSQPRSAA